MLCPELPGCLLWPCTEGGIELVHGFPGPFSLFAVQLAPQGRLPDGFGHQLRNHDAALRVAEAVAPEPFSQAHSEGDDFPGVVGRLAEPGRGSIRVERVVVEGARVHEDEDFFGGDLVPAHFLRCLGRVASDSLAHLLPGRDGSPEAGRDGDSFLVRSISSSGAQEIPRNL
jgi:hypothetical protein